MSKIKPSADSRLLPQLAALVIIVCVMSCVHSDDPRQSAATGSAIGRAVEAEAEAVAARWLKAVRGSDREGASACLATRLRQEPMFTSHEGLSFWREQLFGESGPLSDGRIPTRWRCSAAGEGDQSLVFLTPVVESWSSDEAIWLVREDGVWRIHTLFERP